MYLVTVSVFLYTVFYTPCQIGAFEWADSLPNGAELEVCEGKTATFPWGFHLAPGERVDTVSYHRQIQYGTPDNASGSGQDDGMGTPIVSTDPHFTFTPDHQMIINRATANDTGKYVIKVMVVPAKETETEETETDAQPHVTRVSLFVKVSPAIEEGGPGLQAKLQPQAVMVTGGPQPGWHVQLSCGSFLSLGQPAVTVTWTTPSGTVLPSTSYENGVFSLVVPNPVESGDYSCQVDPRAPVLACVSYKSGLLAQPAVRVDAIEARIILLETRDTELTASNTELNARNTELTARITELTARQDDNAKLFDPLSCRASQTRFPLSGVRMMSIGVKAVLGYCDQDTDGGGWTVIQRRQNGQVNFYRGWAEYVSGFGDASNDFWLGLENIHLLTSDTSYTLRVDMWAFDGTTAYAKYNQFRLGGASNNYRLHISGYSGTADKVTIGSQALRALNETTHRVRNIRKRQATPSISEQQRVVVSSTKDKMAPVSQETEEEYADFEVVSDEDREKADQLVMQEILTYAGYTLACVIVSVILVICFVADPRACIMAFATGSPCCLMCPWYRDLVKYTDPATLIRANVNIYVPGMYVQPDGVLKEYPPSAEEMDALFDLIGEFLSIE